MSESHKKKVICIETGIIYNSRNEAAKAVNVSGSGIGRAIKGEQKKHLVDIIGGIYNEN